MSAFLWSVQFLISTNSAGTVGLEQNSSCSASYPYVYPLKSFPFPQLKALQTLPISMPRVQKFPYALAIGNFIILSHNSHHTCSLSTMSSCPGTPTEAEHLWLQRSSTSFNKEAKNITNGLSRNHPSNPGMLSSAFIWYPWHLVPLAKLCSGKSWPNSLQLRLVKF